MSQHRSSGDIETESKFRIIAPDPTQVIEQLRHAQALGSYMLGPAESLDFHSVYFDTQELDLAKNGAVLRTRLSGGTDLKVTLKTGETPGAVSHEAIYRRVEIEGSPTIPTLKDIWNHLEDIDLVSQPFSEQDFYRVGLEGLFRVWGFQEMFVGDSTRVNRPILDAENCQVAVLSLDRVLFHNPSKSSELFEIEMEAEEGHVFVLPELTVLLQRQFPTQIEPSSKSKYEQGIEFIELQDDFDNETKFNVVGDFQEFVDQMQSKRGIAEFVLGVPSRHKIVDAYFDTPDLRLQENNCYLRLRKHGDEAVLALRQYRSDDGQIIVTRQIKASAMPEVLARIIDKLVDSCVVDIDRAAPHAFPSDPVDAFANIGLYNNLTATIDRLVFPVSDQGRHFANIKLDRVSFSASGKTIAYNEIEIGTENAGDLIRLKALAYTLMSRFRLRSIRDPKYVIGLSLIRTGQIPGSEDQDPIFHMRANMVEGLAHLAKRVRDDEPIQGQAPSNLSELKGRLDLAIERTRSFYKIQGAMALALFTLGLAAIAGGILMALQDRSMVLPVAGIAAGTVLELLIYFPFRQFTRLSKRVELLTALSGVMSISLEGEADLDLRRVYIDRLWSILGDAES